MQKACLAFAMCAMCLSIGWTVLAEEGNIPQDQLNQMGLSGIQMMSDAAGDDIRRGAARSAYGEGSGEKWRPM